MDYDDLKLKTRRGDIEAATELLGLARSRRDTQTVLLCWSVAHPVRFRAWKALDVSMRSAAWVTEHPLALVAQLEGKPRVEEPRAFNVGFNTTERIRTDIIANALLAACRTAEQIPFIKRLNEVSRQILEHRGQVDPKRVQKDLPSLTQAIEALLLSEESALDEKLTIIEERVAQILLLAVDR